MSESFENFKRRGNDVTDMAESIPTAPGSEDIKRLRTIEHDAASEDAMPPLPPEEGDEEATKILEADERQRKLEGNN